MLLLLATTDTIEIITSAAATVDVVSSVQDKTTSSGVIASASVRKAITTATTTAACVTAPASGVERNVVEMSIRNKHASLATDVTVHLNANSTLYQIIKVTLNAGETLEYIEGVGWFTIANTAALDRRLVAVSDVTFATAATWGDITGLTCPLLSGKNYNFIANLYHINNATTTGSQFGVNIGAAPTSLQIATIDTVTASATASVHSAGATATRDTAASVQTTGSAAITMAILSGWIKPSADGIFAVRATSEVTVANGLIVKAGSWCRIWEAVG